MAMKSWARRLLRRCGIDLPFMDVVCTQHAKMIRVFENSQIDVIVRRSLVFLAHPDAGELRDLVPITADSTVPIHNSPDSLELERITTRHGTMVHWWPREPIVLYGQYTHQYGWSYVNGSLEDAMYTELHCDVRTGRLDLEMIAPKTFEAAVAFKRPRWRRLSTEHSLVHYALRQLESNAERPAITDAGTRVAWNVPGPTLGERYICVAFQPGGVQLWRQRLEERSFMFKVRRLLSPLTSGGHKPSRGKRVAMNLNG